MRKAKIDPYQDHLVTEDGKKYKRVFVHYVDGDTKLCDGCDESKENCATIKMLCNDYAILCKDCVMDILTVWDDETNTIQLISHSGFNNWNLYYCPNSQENYRVGMLALTYHLS